MTGFWLLIWGREEAGLCPVPRKGRGPLTRLWGLVLVTIALLLLRFCRAAGSDFFWVLEHHSFVFIDWRSSACEVFE